MPASISTSKLGGVFLAIALVLSSGRVFAADAPKTVPDDEEFTNTPFTEYGTFNEDAEEDAEEQFMQQGRQFGVSIGLGYESAFGNRGQLWSGGFPMLDAKVYYWFDFNFALDICFSMASHNYPTVDSTTNENTIVDVNTTHVGIDLRYYFSVKNMPAAITFINPFVFAGVGAYSKTETAEDNQTTSVSDTALALDAGAGMEFVLVPRSTFFQLEGRVRNATFKDTNSSINGLANLNGLFYAVSASVMFTW